MSEEQEGLEEVTEPPGAVIEIGPATVQIAQVAEEVAPGGERVDFGFVEALMETIHELQAHPRIVSVDMEVGGKVPAFTLDTMEHGLGRLTAPVLRSLFEQVDGVSVVWTWRDDAGVVRPGGQINLSEFSVMFGTWFDVLWEHRTDMSEAELDVLWSLRGLEVITHPDGAVECAAVAFDPAAPLDPALYLYRPGRTMVRWWGSLVDYLYAMLEARGVYGWQRLLSDYDYEADPWGVGSPQSFFEVMGAMFPGTDLGVWRQRLGEA